MTYHLGDTRLPDPWLEPPDDDEDDDGRCPCCLKLYQYQRAAGRRVCDCWDGDD